MAGTAGHIDHGKTSLVRALTGIETDRLEEEKRRGISIDLGFAHLQLGSDLRIAFIDVPGHEKFIKNMLAGVAGIDFVILTVSADESIKPQTREHFEICRLLGIRRGIVALTKADLVDDDLLGLVRLEVEEFVRGSFLEGAPIIPVSAVTGAGLDSLREVMSNIARDLPARDSGRPFRLPIDRAFALKGFGTVVTGTAVAGRVRVEDELEIHGPGRRVRVRNIQVHGQKAAEARAGQRTALNLTGVEAQELRRGFVLTPPDVYREARQIDCRFQLLPDAKPLRHRSPVHLHTGAAEIEAELRLPGLGKLQPGEEAFVRFVLRNPILVLPGDRFIVRLFSPVYTIGGGIVLDIEGPGRLRDVPARSAILARSDRPEIVALLVRESAYGLRASELMARTGWSVAEVERAASQSTTKLRDWFVDPAALNDARQSWISELAHFHQSNPLLPGLAKEDLRSRFLPDAPSALFEAVLATEARIVVEGDLLRLKTHQIALKQDEEQAKAKIESAFAEAGLAVPSQSEVLARSGVDPSRARTILQMLLRERKLLKVGEELVFHHSAIEEVKRMLAARKGERFAVPAFKDWTGVSRKYAIPLLEFLDRERITRREGDQRVVL